MIFPLELFQIVVDLTSTRKELFALRSVSRTFCALVTPRVFRAVIIVNTIRSGEGFLRLSESAKLADYVEEIILSCNAGEQMGGDSKANGSNASLQVRTIFDIDDSDPLANFHKQESAIEQPSDNTDLDDLNYDATRDSLAQAFCQLHKFRALHSLRLSFDPVFEEDDWFLGDLTTPPNRLPLQLSIIRAISSSPRPSSLRSLHLSNLIAFHREFIYDDPKFRAFVGSLKNLSLHVHSGYKFEGTYVEDDICEFWEDTVPRCLLAPPQSFLTSLTLHNDKYVGLGPTVAPHGLYYPHLTFLSFGRMLCSNLHPSCNIEAFISAHRATLQRLELHDCPMFVPPAGHRTAWSALWARFEAELGALRELVVTRTPNGDAREEPYVTLDLIAGWGYVPEYDPVPGAEDDVSALDSLQALLRSRRIKAGVPRS